jgi:hypothetical protein
MLAEPARLTAGDPLSALSLPHAVEQPYRECSTAERSPLVHHLSSILSA